MAATTVSVPVADAEAHGADILRWEGRLHLDVEAALNDLLGALPALGLVSVYLYATLHYLVTPAVLLWTALRRRHGYRVERNALLIATVLGLVGYWLLPTAPPRLIDAGLTDAALARGRRGTLTHIEPHLAGPELTVWRAIAAALFTLLVTGAVLGQGTAAAYAFLLLVPALMMAANRAHWWVRR